MLSPNFVEGGCESDERSVEIQRAQASLAVILPIAKRQRKHKTSDRCDRAFRVAPVGDALRTPTASFFVAVHLFAQVLQLTCNPLHGRRSELSVQL
jgi:hypothetical protein